MSGWAGLHLTFTNMTQALTWTECVPSQLRWEMKKERFMRGWFSQKDTYFVPIIATNNV